MADDEQSLVDATVALSAAADALSISVEHALAAFEKLFVALKAAGTVLSPAAIAARDEAVRQTTRLKTAMDSLDVEVVKADDAVTGAGGSPPPP